MNPPDAPKAAAAPTPVEPSLEAARDLVVKGANVIPVVHRYVEDSETPVSAFLKLRGEGPAFLLESAEQGGQLGRWSFLGFNPRLAMRWEAGTMSEWEGEDALRPDLGKPTRQVPAADPYGYVADRVAGYELAETLDLPPFAGGAVGLFAYDLVRTVEPLGDPNPDVLGIPDLALMICSLIVAFDHHRHEVSIISLAFVDGDSTGGDTDRAYAGAIEAIEAARERLRAPKPATSPRAPRPVPEFDTNMTREQFEAIVARIIEYIYAGDAFQVVPSQRFTAPSPVEAFSIYRGLRAVNPSPYMYFLDMGDFEIAGASPEPLVTVQGDRVETRPIAGTYPRGATEEEDRENARRLVEDPKERAEHVMLVDLSRNDLGRVSEYGSVKVDEMMVVETYSHVLHIVSRVSGRLRSELGAMDVLRSVLPAGTLSGAPKIRAMEIIDELEPHKRCSYGGAIGYLGFGGDLDTAIAIRTAVIKDQTIHIQAGGGTVADAKPDYEYRESLQKAKALFAAIETAANHPEWP